MLECACAAVWVVSARNSPWDLVASGRSLRQGPGSVVSAVCHLFFFGGVGRVWKKKTSKCMAHELLFFCDATYA